MIFRIGRRILAWLRSLSQIFILFALLNRRVTKHGFAASLYRRGLLCRVMFVFPARRAGPRALYRARSVAQEPYLSTRRDEQSACCYFLRVVADGLFFFFLLMLKVLSGFLRERAGPRAPFSQRPAGLL